MKKTLFLLFISFVLIQCQVLKEPVAAVLRGSLPPSEIDSLPPHNNYPIADYNLIVKDLDGNLVKMEDYRGKVIFLNFWATWCLPCVAELPSINKLYLNFKEKDVVFLLISNESLEKVEKYHNRKKYSVPFMLEDATSNIPLMYNSPAIPTTFIINKKGEIVKASSGAEDWNSDEFANSLNKLLR